MTTPETPNGAATGGDEPARRPTLDRTEPVRNIFNAFRQDDGRGKGPFVGDPVWAQDQADTNGAATDDWEPGPLWKSASESVQAGYRVLNQQMREGKTTAATFGAGTPSLKGKALPDILNRLVRTYSDIGAVWVDLLIAATERDSDAPAAGTAQSHAPTPAADTGVAVELTAATPVVARARLYRAVQGSLTALPLRGIGPDAGEIDGVSVGDGPLIQVNVPAGTPAGQYHGILLEDGVDEPAGSVSITVREV